MYRTPALKVLKIHKICSVAAKNFPWACQISWKWQSNNPQFFMA